MLQDLTRESFAPHLNETFRIATEQGDLELLLIEAEPLVSAAETAPRKPFSLVFRGPADPALDQQTLSISHEVLGRLDLFMVPIGQDENGLLYQVVFN